MPTMKNRKHLSSKAMKKEAKAFKANLKKEQEEPKSKFAKGGIVSKYHKKHGGEKMKIGCR